MTHGTTWKMAGVALIVAAAGGGAAFAQSGIATAPDAARHTSGAAASDPEVAGPSTTTVRTATPHKAHRSHKAASAASASMK